MKKSKIIAFCLTLCCALTAWSAPDVAAEQADTTVQHAPVVSLVTFYPGDESFSIYGHTELRVKQDNFDYYFNYGVFNFEAPGFIFRFVTGDALYYCVAVPEKYSLLGMEGRRMVEQELDLSPEEAMEVKKMLVDNILPGNNTYEYRYLTNNCATKPLEIIQTALRRVNHEELIFDKAREKKLESNPVTYRDLMKHYGANYPWQQFGIDLVLGSELDKPLNQEQTAFIPMELMRLAAGAEINHSGNDVPLVKRTTVVVDADEHGLVLPPTPWWCSPLAFAILVLALAIVFTLKDIRRKKITAWFDTALYGSIALVGCVIVFLVCFSNHEAVWPNFNILWAHPLLFIPATLVWCKGLKTRLFLHKYHIGHFIVMGLLLLLWVLIPQRANIAFFPLMIASATRSLNYLIVKRKTAQENKRK